ncbi:Membrin-11 [Mucuna pruriens]|uniref:Membrin n=1 Tax=Mucuna pruriens TaxID=157652 RepID=A0A371GRR9_MUCPR|nr:Membrin-11 [Mucuna pruriens]
MEGGGGTLSEVHQSAKKLLLRSRDSLERLERLEYSAAAAAVVAGADSELSFAVKKDITQIQSLCVEMDRLWRSVAAKPQRDLWKRKVEQIAEEAESLRASLDKYNLRNQNRMREANERAELLGRAVCCCCHALVEWNGDSAHVLRIYDEEAQAIQSVRTSSRELENANALGEAILSSMHGQRERLKSAHRKAWDILNTVGISNSVLRLIERRNRVDQWIKYAGMLLTVIFLFAFVLWRH